MSIQKMNAARLKKALDKPWRNREGGAIYTLRERLAQGYYVGKGRCTLSRTVAYLLYSAHTKEAVSYTVVGKLVYDFVDLPDLGEL